MLFGFCLFWVKGTQGTFANLAKPWRILRDLGSLKLPTAIVLFSLQDSSVSLCLFLGLFLHTQHVGLFIIFCVRLLSLLSVPLRLSSLSRFLRLSLSICCPPGAAGLAAIVGAFGLALLGQRLLCPSWHLSACPRNVPP